MFRRIHIENFKGVGSPVTLELKPLTLLFGPNSSGKSTVLHAIHYAHAVLQTSNPDVDRTRLGGDIELGGFRALIHNHDLSAKVVLGFEFDVGEEEFEEHMAWYLREPAEDVLVQGLETVYAELTMEWSSVLDRPYVSSFVVSLNDDHLARITAAVDGTRSTIEDIRSAAVLVEYCETAAAESLELSGLVASDEGVVPVRPTFDCMPRRGSAIPYWGRSLETPEVDEDTRPPLSAVEAMLVAASRCLNTALEGLRYVGPIRQAPPRNYAPPASLDESRWARGLGAWDAMARDGALRKQVSKWLDGPDYLDTGYQIKWHSYRELDDETFLLMEHAAREYRLDDDFQRFAATLVEKGRLALKHGAAGTELAPCDVGEGISQVVPVVAAALASHVTTPSGAELDSTLVCVEQPELHIHPRMQVVLGDLFLDNCGERQFLIETHSEHLMLRLLRRIRETSDGELPPGAPETSTDTVQVLYIDSDARGTKVKALRIGDDGEFLDLWPTGFFDERYKELY